MKAYMESLQAQLDGETTSRSYHATLCTFLARVMASYPTDAEWAARVDDIPEMQLFLKDAQKDFNNMILTMAITLELESRERNGEMK